MSVNIFQLLVCCHGSVQCSRQQVGHNRKQEAAGGGRGRQEAARWPGVMSAGVTTESYTQDAAAVLQRLETRSSHFYTHLTDHVLMEFTN